MKRDPSRTVYIAFTLIALIYISAGSWIYPMQGDDFAFCADVREKGMDFVIPCMYLNWTLRTGEVFNFLLLYGEKTIFNILNPVIQLFLVWSLFLAGFRRKPDWKSPEDCRIFAFLMAVSCFCVARPRDTVYWMTGAMVYSFGCALWFTFWGILNLPRQKNVQNKAAKGVLLALLGIASACAIENAMAVGVLLTLLFAANALYRKEMPDKVVIFALAGYLAGAVISAIAPGRWERAANEGALGGVCDKLKTIPEVAIFWGGSAWFALLLCVLAAVLLFICDRKKFREELPVCGGLLALSVISDAAFVAGGVTPAVRAYLFSSLLIALAAARVIMALPKNSLKNFIAGVAVLYAVVLMASAVPDFLTIRVDSQMRDKIIANSAVGDVTVPAHRTVRKSFLQYIWIEDYTNDPANPFNRSAARFYNVNTIRVEAAPEAVLFWKRSPEKKEK